MPRMLAAQLLLACGLCWDKPFPCHWTPVLSCARRPSPSSVVLVQGTRGRQKGAPCSGQKWVLHAAPGRRRRSAPLPLRVPRFSVPAPHLHRSRGIVVTCLGS